MKIIFEDVNPEEANVIFSRLANYSFDEMTDNDRLERIFKFVRQGHDIDEAKYMFQEDIVDETVEKIVKPSEDPEVQSMTREDIKEQYGFQEPEVHTNLLHLREAPPLAKRTITKRELANYASKLTRGSTETRKQVADIIHQFGVKKLVDLSDDVLDKVYQKLQELEA